MKIKYLKSNNKKNNKIKTEEMKFFVNSKTFNKMKTNKLYIDSNESGPLQTPHITFTTLLTRCQINTLLQSK